ncbi:50S ribosomal protein L13 [Candidatus Micrarchaeota archaeon]|nr:50S ribosomal protein L13 [Candidatus Micrarchaeota archaeon]
MIVIDGKDMILGKLASHVAKELLKKEEMIILNAEHIIITGNKKDIMEKYLKRRSIKPKQNPSHRPKWPRVPNLLVRRVVRGMVPYSSSRGREAYKRLRVVEGIPEKYKEKISDKNYDKLKSKSLKKFITVKQLCEYLGYNG